MDFYQIETKYNKDSIDIYPDFKVCRSKDLMIRGGSFYAIWDEARQLWSTDEYDVQRLVDQDLEAFKEEYLKKYPERRVTVKRMSAFGSRSWQNYRAYLRELSDNSHQLDDKIVFANQEVKKTDYISRRLPYPIGPGTIAAYDEMIGTLYSQEEKQKLEWAIGAIVSGDAKNIQKFIVLYGEQGSGKSTFLNIVEKMFDGYCTMFEAKALTTTSNIFSTEVFRNNPLVAIQHDGDLSRIEDNTKLNSIVSHENMTMHEKYKPSYTSRSNAFLFMGTNKPVRITDAKSGLLRRLIDVRPSGEKVPTHRYHTLMSQLDFELGAIAHHCLTLYKTMGKNYYSNYKPLDMMFQTDVFFNYVEDNFYIFREQDGVSLNQAYEMYKTYCEDSLVEFKLAKYKFREELKSYFRSFEERGRADGKQVRNYYSGFIASKFANQATEVNIDIPASVVLDETTSIVDELLSMCPAQYATDRETPEKTWAEVKTTLADIDTSRLHYVRPPLNHIVIDFDLKDENGKKSLEKNLEAVSKWPPTYSELSKGGSGIHLHYNYDGDAEKLSRVFAENIEVKVFSGLSSLRRKVTKVNNSPIATLKSGLPLKGEKMINFDHAQNEKHLRAMILKNLRKEIHPATKPSIDFIHKILEDAYSSGMKYDVTDMRPRIHAFANNSSNQSEYCIKLVMKMQFASDEPSETPQEYQSEDLIFFDVEVFPNLFVVVWKAENKTPVRMINPTPKDIEELLRFKLVGFNNRRYDNHILYARYIGYSNEELYILSQRIVANSRNGMFGEAYNLSYTDVYDFSSKKQSLKKFQLELGIHHQELGLPWDQPVSEDLWDKVAEYCVNDVVSLEKVFEARKQDFIARLILSDLSGLTPNDTTQMHTAKIIFGDDKRPQDKFVYTDLSEMFPGYSFESGKSMYRDEDPSEGGYVWAEPGMYSDAAVLDITSMHPTSAILMNIFGPYTKNFKELLDARVAIKHGEYDRAKTMHGGILSKYLTSDGDSGALSYALKIVINIVYGLTSAKFDNKFKDPRNKDNIVAKRGALFMIDLKHAVQEKGFTVAHIKTDSIKIPNATPEIIDFVMEFGKKYGYTFEHEETYKRFCLVNKAVFIAKKSNGTWTATGDQFAQPYVFKTLFSHDKIQFDDLYETKTVTSSLYLDMNESLGEDEHEYHFVGKAGAFCPIKPGCNGGLLLREKDGKYHAATGSKGYRWLEAEMVKELGREDDIDRDYYNTLVDEAITTISKFGDFEWFISNDDIDPNVPPPWCQDGNNYHEACSMCSHLCVDPTFGKTCRLGKDLPF